MRESTRKNVAVGLFLVAFEVVVVLASAVDGSRGDVVGFVFRSFHFDSCNTLHVTTTTVSCCFVFYFRHVKCWVQIDRSIDRTISCFIGAI